ncbi:MULTISPECIES: hypothetical protein [unclassified Leptolyngbya]|uniref:hypothetical protein n=1 Tax=unclassified Leptolyngbya TaxID=2650499 RepID=UPI00168763BE|nr:MULTISPECIES: hypothetical protein [unclassified Leptolyngbya]MBD1910886.1 hypothetical protein [Leptolyngbya sp. FACHB-8]MBD2153719.1 hypothetical protein [Leptolyngbya sp. FACHB-16]
MEPLTVAFGDRLKAVAMQVPEDAPLDTVLELMQIPHPRPVLVLIGGASQISASDQQLLRSLFVQVLAPLAQTLNAVVVDGGTDAGIMRMMGRARIRTRGTFPLLGVAPVGLVALPDQPLPNTDAAYLEPHHTHFLMIPGAQWGAESEWIARLATAIAQDEPSVTLLINGGEVSWLDTRENVEEGRPVIAIAGSGRTADVLATALEGKITDERAHRIVKSGLLQAIHLRSPKHLTQVIEQILSR